MARPRTPGGAYGSIAVRRRGDRVIAETRIRDAHGRIRHSKVTGSHSEPIHHETAVCGTHR